MPPRKTHVRYSSPFGSPSGYMPREDAERHLKEDDENWVEWSRLNMLTEQQKTHGPPRIEELPK